MTDVPQDTTTRLGDAAARAAEATPGVAFLRPDLTGFLRGAAARGTRLRRTATADGEQVHVDLRLAVHRGHRAVDVTRAARTAVERAVVERLPGASVSVTVTVTALV
ncbi:Asp23/Gls24 family envelope stress response protein [Streptomyces sp. GSL17-111]|uniref:Asp23/Gls24 family envelope stress response protein n=1 Tax=Streptomyces sp. GSL17-111 TaxID=3121596 RepID=UPI0030F475C4